MKLRAIFCNKMKNETYHTVETAPKSNRKITERVQKKKTNKQTNKQKTQQKLRALFIIYYLYL